MVTIKQGRGLTPLPFFVFARNKTAFSFNQVKEQAWQKEHQRAPFKKKEAKANTLLLKFLCKINFMKIFLAKNDRLLAPSHFGFIQI